jgi:hypothetical protein
VLSVLDLAVELGLSLFELGYLEFVEPVIGEMQRLLIRIIHVVVAAHPPHRITTDPAIDFRELAGIADGFPGRRDSAPAKAIRGRPGKCQKFGL